MNRQETIQKYVHDMLALQRHVLEAVERQRDDEKVRTHPEVNEIVIRIERMLKAHLAELETVADEVGGGKGSVVKKALGGALGVAAGLYDKMRSHELSRMLRDNYTALNLAAISYAMMHTMALAVTEEDVARVAKRHLAQIPPLLEVMRRLLPHVVADEIAHQDEFSVVSDAGATAVVSLADAWNGAVAETPVY